MNLNNLVNSDQLAEQTDSIGGRQLFPSDIYDAVISCIYLTESKGGATGAVVDLKIQGKDYRETVWFTNRNGENFYISKQDGSKQGLPGWNLMDAMSMCSIGKGFLAALGSREEKVVKVYDYESKSEQPTNVPVVMDMLNAKVKVGLLHQIVNKREQDATGAYVEVDETREENVIHSVFHPDTRKTYSEMKNNADATFADKWLAKFKTGAPLDKSKKTGNAPSAGKTGATREVKPIDRTALFGA